MLVSPWSMMSSSFISLSLLNEQRGTTKNTVGPSSSAGMLILWKRQLDRVFIDLEAGANVVDTGELT